MAAGIRAITLFVEDVEAAKQFYREIFGLPVAFEDDDSAVFDFGNTIINLLKTSAARELIEPAVVAPGEAGACLQLTIEVDDLDAMCAELATRGVELLNGPLDRPWGVRTASFRDRAIDEHGQVIDVYVSPHRAAEDAKAFFRKSITSTGVRPRRVTTDKAACYPPALAEVLPEAEHVTGKPEQQRLERDHQHLIECSHCTSLQAA